MNRPLTTQELEATAGEAIAQTVPDVEGLALVDLDRFQQAHDPAVPLAGPVLPAAARTLADLARTTVCRCSPRWTPTTRTQWPPSCPACP